MGMDALRDTTRVLPGGPVTTPMRRQYLQIKKQYPDAVSYTHLTLPTTPYV